MEYFVKGKGKPVVMIHGFLENHKMWNDVTDELPEGFMFILPDLPGHGKSKVENEISTMQSMADGINEILEELKIKNATFIGHSMGGYVSLAFAEKFPEKINALMLFFSSPLADSAEKKEQRLEAAEVVKKDKESFIRLSVPKLFNPNQLDQLRNEIDTARKWANEMTVDGIVAALKGMRERKNTMAVLENTTMPVSVVLGEFDGAVKADDLIEKLPAKDNIQTTVLAVGHMGHLEAPADSVRLISEFIKG